MNTRIPIRRTPLLTAIAAFAALAAACAGGNSAQAQSATGLGDNDPVTVSTTQLAPTTSLVAPLVAVSPATTLPTTAAPPPAPATTSTTTTVPPLPPPFRADPEEVHTAAKQLGGEIAQLLTTYDTGAGAADIAATVTSDPDQQAALAAAMAPLLHDGRWSRGTVIYPQLGGVTAHASSIMVVVRQEVGSAGRVELVETRTLDVRLVKQDDTWRFAELASAGGTAIDRPGDLPAAAIAVLDNPRIELPDSARWDIYRGHTSIELLELMDQMAQRVPFGVVVLASGHPHNVFATDRTSNHTVGRAVDVYRLDERRVIDDRTEDSLSATTLRWLYDHEAVYKIGGPWALDGTGGKSFTDIVHQDHLHIAVKG